MHAITLATRGSPLALWQARAVAAALRGHTPGLRVRLHIVQASGDADLVTPLYAMAGVGVFVKEVQAAVLAGKADAGVHSCKDLPTAHPPGLVLAAMLPRHDVRDCLVGAESFAALAPGAVLGTSSTRRRAQALLLRPDLQVHSIRGNVATRLKKISDGQAQATIMAMAGLRRLGLARVVRARPLCPITIMAPAPGQGAVAIDCRSDDRRLRGLLGGITCLATWRAVQAERELLAGLEGGCSLPLGCWVRRVGAQWHLSARMPQADGMRQIAVHGPGLAVLVSQALRHLR